ncbi:uncharacterized protein N7473_011203 [Penicillium subrubescens]|uniref:uncharacterized protein n=1 Tax=Penicillium subrubescens TaxID=1316194 RepID=UPI002544D346|nr:uncharacterized protein N7473_013133 [Penicillium subrubescens]XP_057004264.1 uncharacterized protein N7473_011203 [Penicillium subrubescens]KAJ5875020.1 hypothetical protein N7473_013133 [Penicillium subrubescens]KAJ5882769.1 hypothetical protein N7473_011203 [Penicillium subrubescens]
MEYLALAAASSNSSPPSAGRRNQRAKIGPRISKSSQREAQQRFRDKQKARREEDQRILETQGRQLEEERKTNERLNVELEVLKAENVQLERRAKAAEQCSTLLQDLVKAFQDRLCAGVGNPSMKSGSLSATALISGPISPQFSHGNHLRARSFPPLVPPPRTFRSFGNALITILTSSKKSNGIRETSFWASNVPNLTDASADARSNFVTGYSFRLFK